MATTESTLALHEHTRSFQEGQQQGADIDIAIEKERHPPDGGVLGATAVVAKIGDEPGGDVKVRKGLGAGDRLGGEGIFLSPKQAITTNLEPS